MINSFKAADIAVSGLSVNITPATDTEGLLVTGDTNTGTITIAAGALWVKIENAGLVVSGDAPGNITVNGATWTPGRNEQIYAIFDPAQNDYIHLPQITIVTTGARVRYAYFG